jgi:adenylyltransferase/sulfurtransferase
MLKAQLPDCELTVFADGRAIVKGTDKPEVARTIYARYIGS